MTRGQIAGYLERIRQECGHQGGFICKGCAVLAVELLLAAMKEQCCHLVEGWHISKGGYLNLAEAIRQLHPDLNAVLLLAIGKWREELERKARLDGAQLGEELAEAILAVEKPNQFEIITDRWIHWVRMAKDFRRRIAELEGKKEE